MIIYKEFSSLLNDLEFSGKTLYSVSNHIRRHYRTVKIPSFLIEELKDFTESLGPLEPNSHIFETSKSTLLKHLHEGAAKAGVEDICVHCLRHSYISMCVYNGIPYTTISTQVGHSKFLQTLHYSHSYKNSGDFLVNALEQVKGDVANV